MGSLPHAISHGESFLNIAAALAWPLANLAVAGWAGLRLLRRRWVARAEQQSVRRHGPVAVLRPCAGHEPYLRETLRSSRCLHELGDVGDDLIVRFLVASETDSAFAVANEVATDLREGGMDASVLVTHARDGNRKARQLMAAEQQLPSNVDVVLVADADVRLDAALAKEMLTELAPPAVGAVWAPPRECAAASWGDVASKGVLDASLHAFPVLAALDPRGMVGKCFAIRRDALSHIGGFAKVSHVLGEDMELSRLLHAGGHRVVATSRPADARVSGRPLRAALQRFARWISVIRHQRMHLLVSYPLLFAAMPLQIFLSLALSLNDPVAGLTLLVSSVLTRLLIALLARWSTGRDMRGLPSAMLFGDVTLLAAWAMVLFGLPVSWRGVPLRFGPNGQLRGEV